MHSAAVLSLQYKVTPTKTKKLGEKSVVYFVSVLTTSDETVGCMYIQLFMIQVAL